MSDRAPEYSSYDKAKMDFDAHGFIPAYADNQPRVDVNGLLNWHLAEIEKAKQEARVEVAQELKYIFIESGEYFDRLDSTMCIFKERVKKIISENTPKGTTK